MALDLHHVVDGPADAPAVLFGPSLGTDLHLFDAQVAALSDRYRCVRFDLPGHGGSPDADGDLTIADLAAGALAAADAAGVTAFHYVGVSIGGAVGQWLGVHGGERVRSIAVLATAARFPNPDSWPQRAATVREQGTEAMVASRPGTWYVEDWARRDPAGETRLLDMLRAARPGGYAACCAAIGAFDIRDELGSVAVPALVVAGADDPATPPSCLREIADGIPGARYAEVPDSAHLLNYERPAEVDALLAEHLDAQV
ncbi:adhesin [Pseudonocardia sp. EC080610-09]|uniref:3-oxoadipate enol-lactonase n=1 Tax=unclassified Pseudonocardia TaxID=2619320 RepID=UPI0006CB23ED|nr:MULTISPECIES: 3-oxoadipate enol-lactonase [unclassified Pseudonocardia]ALE75347.1 adhesin [Pseudonocardia sp. EC080625-04]ALL74707.1 adhesin [Pseudonocardia sp. EC080610-09]ALL81730.1 adhesin [Pseudonocardia sp. EC080619-01]